MTEPMADRPRTPASYDEAVASWQSDAPVPVAADARLTLQLESLRGLSAVRRQVRAFLLATVGTEDAPVTPEAEDGVDQAILVIDELASNALRHGSPPSSLRIGDEEERWIVVVTDGAPDRLPLPARGRAAGQGGYGLYVVTDLTAAHGVHREADRKMVWVCLQKPTGAS